MELSIVVPTYNEKENIQEIIKLIFEDFSKNKIEGEVVVVDDGSPDGTAEIVRKLMKSNPN